LPVAAAEPLKLQFDAFLDAVESRKMLKLDGRMARQTLKTALDVLDKIKEHSGVVEKTLASGWKP
jgi:hypothetical protein